jgi:hypothetical protein
MHLFQVVIAGLIFLGIGVVLLVMFGAKQDPNEKNDDFDERDIYNRDMRNMFTNEKPPKMKAK